jgi:hypothetical protein
MSISAKSTVQMKANPTAQTVKTVEEKRGVRIRKDLLCKCGHKESAHTHNPQESGRACTENLAAPWVISNKVALCTCREFKASISST